MATDLRIERWAVSSSAGAALATLNGAALATDTTITVNDASVFPSTGDFDVVINDSEVATVIGVSANTLTLSTGLSGGHADTSNVMQVLTTDSIDRAITSVGPNLLYPLHRFLDQDGTTLVDTDFSWFNQGSATITEKQTGGYYITFPDETYHNIRGKLMTAPSTPWKVTCHVQFGNGHLRHIGSGEGTYGGILARESSSNQLYMMALRGDVVALWQMDTYNTFNADVNSKSLNNIYDNVWIQLEDDGTNVKGYISTNGYDFFEIWSEGRTSWMSGGIDEIGFGGSSGIGATGGGDAEMWFDTWIIE